MIKYKTMSTIVTHDDNETETLNDAEWFRQKAFKFNLPEYYKAHKIINQAADMGQVEVNISDKDVNNLQTIGEMLKRDGFEVIPSVISNGTYRQIINITVSW